MLKYNDWDVESKVRDDSCKNYVGSQGRRRFYWQQKMISSDALFCCDWAMFIGDNLSFRKVNLRRTKVLLPSIAFTMDFTQNHLNMRKTTNQSFKRRLAWLYSINVRLAWCINAKKDAIEYIVERKRQRNNEVRNHNEIETCCSDSFIWNVNPFPN